MITPTWAGTTTARAAATAAKQMPSFTLEKFSLVLKRWAPRSVSVDSDSGDVYVDGRLCIAFNPPESSAVVESSNGVLRVSLSPTAQFRAAPSTSFSKLEEFIETLVAVGWSRETAAAPRPSELLQMTSSSEERAASPPPWEAATGEEEKLKACRGGGSKKLVSLAMVCVSSLFVATSNLVVTASKVDGAIKYSATTPVLCSELMKFTLCAILLAVSLSRGSRDEAIALWRSLSLRSFAAFAVPSALYAVDNNLVYLILARIDAATFAVLWNVKIIEVAILFRVVLGQRLPRVRWAAALLLFLGVVASQSERVDFNLGNYKHGHAVASVAAPPGTSTGATFLIGILLLFGATTLSALAGIFTELVFKRGSPSGAHFFVQQLQFTAWAVVVNGALLIVRTVLSATATATATPQLFDNFNRWVWLSIVVNSLQGLVTALLLKYADNMANVFVQAGAMIFTAAASTLFFGHTTTLAFAVGIAVCCVAIYLYNVPLEYLTRRSLVDDAATATAERGSGGGRFRRCAECFRARRSVVRTGGGHVELSSAAVDDFMDDEAEAEEEEGEEDDQTAKV